MTPNGIERETIKKNINIGTTFFYDKYDFFFQYQN